MLSASKLVRAALMVGVVASTLLAGGTAQAAAPAENARAARVCQAVAVYGNTPIYKSKSTKSKKVGNMIKGRSYAASCYPQEGQFYYACNYFSSRWVRINNRGWVKYPCVRYYV